MKPYLILSAICLTVTQICTAQFVPRNYCGAKSEPENKILLSAGQSDEYALPITLQR